METAIIQPAYPFLWLLFLLDFALKGTLIILAAFAAMRILRRASAAVRHAVWFLALVAVLLQPLATNLLPDWRVPLLPRVFENSTLNLDPDVRPEEELANDLSPLEYGERLLGSNPETKASALSEEEPPPVELYDPLAGLTMEADRIGLIKVDEGGDLLLGSPHWSFWIFFIWFAGFVLVLIRLLVGAIASFLVIARSTKQTDPAWESLLSKLSRVLGIRRKVRLHISEHMHLPKSGGILCPVVVLPAKAERWDRQRRSLVLMHELAHIRRWDILTLMVSRFACAVNWFNPLVWLAHLHMRNEMERSCDDMVITSGIVPSSYALHLAEIARSLQSPRPSWASAAMAHRSSLKDRLKAILDPIANRKPFNPARILSLGLVIILLMLPLAAFHPWVVAESPRVEKIVELSEKLGTSVDVEELTAMMSDSDSAVRARAAILLSGLDSGLAAGRLAVALYDSDPLVRQYAAWGLGRLAYSCTAGSLRNALNDPEPEVRQQVLWALGRMGADAAWALAAGAGNSDPFIRQQTLHAISRVEDDEAVSTLIAALDDEVSGVRRQAVVELARIGDERIIPGLNKAMQDPNTEIRRMAVSYLREIRGPKAVPGLASALQDDANVVRNEAVDALGNLGHESAIDPLIAAAVSDPSNEIRINALRELGRINDIRILPAYAAALGSDSNEVKTEAIMGLCRLNDNRTVELLNGALIDTFNRGPFDDELRMAIIHRLDDIGHPSSFHSLLFAYRQSNNLELRRAARQILARL